ncbi:hypothetical protein FDUTEX481_05333 [Tolypothrix sp. PCC 7601]|nr:hypothetical protein FDUTEX481_05333 [Tolypothrix sp. PCC 7601]
MCARPGILLLVVPLSTIYLHIFKLGMGAIFMVLNLQIAPHTPQTSDPSPLKIPLAT